MAPVGCSVVQELDRVAVDEVSLIDERALQDIKAVYVQFGQAKGIYFCDKDFFQGVVRMGNCVCRQVPALEGWIKLAQYFLVFAAGELLAGVFVVFVYKHRAILYHFFHGEVARKGSVLIAVDAVVLALAAVGVSTQNLFGKRHSAALTKFLFHSVEKKEKTNYGKNKPTPLKDEPVMSLDDVSTKLDNLAAAIGALQKEPCEPVVPKVNIQAKGLHFKTEEEFREKVILLYKGLGIYNQEQEDAYIKELHDKGELSNREMLQAIYKKTCAIPDGNNHHAPNSLKDQLIHRWHKIKECIRIVFYEPSNKWYRNVYAWICIILTLLFTIFTIYEVVNVNRLKAYNEDLQTIAAQHQMPREIVKKLDSKLFITLDGYDELVKQQGFASTWRKFKAAQEQTKQE